jgi:hypothetical protein
VLLLENGSKSRTGVPDKLLEFNDQFDFVKISLSKEMLHLRLRDHLKTGRRGSLKIRPTETRGRNLNGASLRALGVSVLFSLLPLLFLALRMYRAREQYAGKS